MKNILICILLLLAGLMAAAQQENVVKLMDFVKIKNSHTKEALYYYENNWKVYRDLALKKGMIHGYEIVRTAPDTLNNFDLILITVYKDSVQYAKSEENFRPILAALRPNGPILLNEIKPTEFRQNVFAKMVYPVYTSPRKRKGR